MYKFARHSSHKADDDFLHSGKALELDPFINTRDDISLVVEL